MAVFSMLAVALLYRGSSAECSGVYTFGIPVGPLDVCVTNSISGFVTSSMYTCEGDVGSIMTFAGADCSGTGTADSSGAAAFFTFVCPDAGESCGYGVARTYANDSTGACLDDYTETASFVDQCTDLTATVGTTSSIETTCTATTANQKTYLSADCSGTAVAEEALTDDACAELISCNSDGTDDGTDSDDDTDTEEPTTTEEAECEGYYVLGAALSPLDVCLNNVTSAGETTSSKYTCTDDVGVTMTYDAADCAGTGTSVALNPFFERMVCEGLTTCNYGLSKGYEGEVGDCGAAYEENAIFTDRCIALPDDDRNSQSFMVSCSGASGSITYYEANDCSGAVAETEDIADSCDTIETCTSFGSSSASLPAALLAMVVSAIALIA